MRYRSLFASLLLSCMACGPKLPPRYVVEHDLEGFRYRRYQQVLDVELPIAGNPAVGHTATYVRTGAELQVAPVFVTVYERARGLTETVRGRLRTMQSYTFDVVKREGEHVYRLRGEGGDVWFVWVSGRHLVKVGAPEGADDMPEDLAEAYLDLYPSDLDEKGRAQDDKESAGAAVSSAPQSDPSASVESGDENAP